MNGCFCKLKAFTLSEVLITLVVIGVIAAISVPTIAPNLQKQYVERCKKVYSTLAQSANRAIADNGSMDLWEVPDGDIREKNKFFVKNFVLPYVINAKDCGDSSDGQCKFDYKWMNENEIKSLSYDWHKVILNDGSAIAFQTNGSMDSDYCFVLAYADINGGKKPNKFGRDIYTFVYWLKNPNVSRAGRFEAYGNDWSRQNLLTSKGTNACNKGSSGQLCAALLMKDSWEMKEDYPY